MKRRECQRENEKEENVRTRINGKKKEGKKRWIERQTRKKE
jgi:hypothetical protein